MKSEAVNYSISLEIPAEDLVLGYDHVHHATAVSYLERARLAYLETIGHPNESLLARNLFLVITEIQLRYMRELKGGKIEVTCENPRLEGKRVVVDQRVLNNRGKVAVDAVVKSAFMDGETKRAIVVPDFFLQDFLAPLYSNPKK